MKKSSILGVLTASALIMTSAGTYAAWDTLTATSEKKDLSINSAVTVTAGSLSEFQPTSLTTLTETPPTYTSSITFNVVNDGSRAKTLTLKPIIYEDGTETDITSKFTVVFTQTDPDTGLSGDVDSVINTGTNTYGIEITPKDKALAGTPVDVKVTATLS